MRSKRIISMGLIYLFLLAYVVVALIPFLWIVSSSFKTMAEIFSFPPTLIPENPTLDSFKYLFTESPMLRWILNSLLVSGGYTFFALLFCSLGGFAFAKYNFPFKNALFFVLISTLMIPIQVTMIPLFKLMLTLNWVNSYWALIIPGSANAFGIFLMRQYLLSVPDELIDAARIDGCSDFKIYYKIVLPLIRPALGALSILMFLGSWNDFIWPLIILRDSKMYTVNLGVASLYNMFRTFERYDIIIAGSFWMSIPVIIFFLLRQRDFISGLTLGSVKE
ncbi:MAG: carbohydrate ABC transporter permease [Actinobacteria bacterium]|nr:carbohydrate ABC transporter permease [Actinomycetota bacterium]